jgi:hypothetical protein
MSLHGLYHGGEPVGYMRVCRLLLLLLPFDTTFFAALLAS